MRNKRLRSSTTFHKIKHILVGGAKGVGKTTLLRLLTKKGFNVIIFSEILKSSAPRILGKKFLKLNEKERDFLRIKVAEEILNRAETGFYVWEVHFCCYEFGKKRIVVPNNLLANSSSFILFKLEENILKERRLNDSIKKRSILQKNIKRDSKIEEEAVKKFSKEYKIPLTYYTNNQNLKASINSFDAIIRTLI